MAQRKLSTHLVAAHGLSHAMAEGMQAVQLGAPDPSHAGSQAGRLPGAHGGRALTGSSCDPLDGARGLSHFARERCRIGPSPAMTTTDTDDMGTPAATRTRPPGIPDRRRARAAHRRRSE